MAPPDVPALEPEDEPTADPPAVDLPRAPRASLVWSRALVVAWVALGLFFLDRLASLLMNYWFFQSLGFQSVFWTNFWAQAVLWTAGTLGFTVAIAAPAFAHTSSRRARRSAVS